MKRKNTNGEFPEGHRACFPLDILNLSVEYPHHPWSESHCSRAELLSLIRWQNWPTVKALNKTSLCSLPCVHIKSCGILSPAKGPWESAFLVRVSRIILGPVRWLSRWKYLLPSLMTWVHNPRRGGRKRIYCKISASCPLHPCCNTCICICTYKHTHTCMHKLDK